MASTAHVDELIAAYTLGALNATEHQQVEQHLISCRLCAEMTAEEERLVALLPYAATPYTVPPDLKQSIFNQLEGEQVEQHSNNVKYAGAAIVEPSAQHTMEPPAWALPTRQSRLLRVAALTIPWTVAMISWVVVAALLAYSHGQSDRLRTAQQDDLAQMAVLNQQLLGMQTLQGFLSTPKTVQVIPFAPAVGAYAGAGLSLVLAPHYAHGLVVARGLKPLAQPAVYQVWAKSSVGWNAPIGVLTTTGSQEQGVALLVGQIPLDQYRMIGINIEQTTGAKLPTSPMIFTIPV